MAQQRAGGEQHVEDSTHTTRRGGRMAVGTTRSDATNPCAMTVGTKLGYDVTTQTHTVVDTSKLLGQVQSSDGRVGFSSTPSIDRRGERGWHVDLQVISHDTRSTVMAAHIEGGDVVLDSNNRRAPSEQLDATFLVRLDGRCAIEEFGWHTDADLGAAQEQQTLMAALNFLAPPEAGVARYAGGSFDAAGHYEARYTMAGDDVIEGVISSYDQVFASAQGGIEIGAQVDTSALDITLAPGRWFSELTHARELTLLAQSQAIGTLSARTRAVAALPSGWAADVANTEDGWRWGLLLGRRIAEVSPKTNFDEALVGVGIEQILDRFLTGYQTGATREASELLTQWLRANPEATGDLLAVLRSGGIDDNPQAYAGTFLALGMADTPQCHEALVAMVGDPSGRGRDAISAAHAMSMVASPREDMLAAMAELSQRDGVYVGDRSSVAMAIGAFASENELRAPELAAQAREHIREALVDPQDTDELAGSLYAAGNVGHDELLGTVGSYLDHDDPDIRRHATHALRNMSPEEVYPHLESSLIDDDQGVRIEALKVATEVSRNGRVAPSSMLVDDTIGLLDGEPTQAEQGAALDLLGLAAQHGSTSATNALSERFEDELLSDERNLDRLQALGRQTNVRWTAD